MTTPPPTPSIQSPGQTPDSLNSEFGMPGVLEFTRRGELTVLQITSPAATAALALQGAHLLSWQPASQAPALFLSERSEFVSGKAVRGGVPVIWPWFGPRSEAVPPAPAGAPKSPSHGFARTSLWRLDFAAVTPDAVHLTLTLAPSPESRAFGFDGFRLVYQLILGRDLTLRLAVANDGPSPLRFEEALHTYFSVGDIHRVSLSGTESIEYLDKPDGMKRKQQPASPLTFTAVTDRVYLATEATCLIDDPVLARTVHIRKENSRNTVVWNPWSELTAGLHDMEPSAWHHMLCVETANVGAESITLAPGTVHTLEAHISLTANVAGDGSIGA